MPIERRPIRLAARNYRGAHRYFVTICSESRSPVFLEPALCNASTDLLRSESLAAGFLVLAYCFMPDHLHLLEARTDTANLIRFIKTFKQKSGYDYRQLNRSRLWQRFFYDHILRGSDSMHAVAWYIWLNPVRAGLCTDPRDFPFSGSFCLEWKTKVAPQELWTPTWKGRSKKEAT